MIFSKEIIGLLFGRGAFTLEAIDMTANSLFYYSIGMLAFGLRDILSRAFYALQDTKTPMINGTIAVVLNIILNLILSRFLGIGGLAFSYEYIRYSWYHITVYNLKEKNGGFGLKEIIGSFKKLDLPQ